MYGRLDAGTAMTTTTHQNDDTSMATPATANCHNRRPSLGGPATR